MTGRIMAVAGKGGTGKTTLSSLLVRHYAAKGLRVLAVDADPPVSLTYALGAQPKQTVGDLRARLITDPDEKRRLNDIPMARVMEEELVMPAAGASLLVLGQAESAGCFCGLNELLKYGIESLSKKYDLTIIDCEAGIEQINRRVITAVDTLIMVSDPTMKGLRTAKYLKDIAEKYGVLGDCRTGLVINRVVEPPLNLEEKAKELKLDIWGFIPLDHNVSEYDLHDKPTVSLPADSPCVQAVGMLAANLGGTL